MRRLLVFFSLSSLLIIASCYERFDYPYLSLDGVNNSDSDVWFSHYIPNLSNPSNEVKAFRNNDADADAVLYYRTEFLFSKRKTTSIVFGASSKSGWEWVKRRLYPDSLRIRVWRDELIQEVWWEEFVQNMGTKYKYELEYVLDIDDLDKLYYRITYPPSGAIEQLRIVYPE